MHVLAAICVFALGLTDSPVSHPGAGRVNTASGTSLVRSFSLPALVRETHHKQQRNNHQQPQSITSTTTTSTTTTITTTISQYRDGSFITIISIISITVATVIITITYYETLRKWGLSLAFIFFVAGLLIVFSERAHTRSVHRQRHRGDRSDSLIPAQSTA
ncbi:unnamed protein product [Lampetra planeri]